MSGGPSLVRIGRILSGVLAIGVVAGCSPAPVSSDRAARECRAEAPLADGFRGTAGVGVGSGGATGKAGMTVTNRIVSPQSEADYMAECIERRRTGAPAPVTFGVTVGGRL